VGSRSGERRAEQDAAAVPNFAWLECNDTPVDRLNAGSERFFPRQLQLRGDCFPVPLEAGLGIEVNEAEIRNAAADYRPWEQPHVYRRDGAIQLTAFSYRRIVIRKLA
jgi:galactonate dehydratase